MSARDGGIGGRRCLLQVARPTLRRGTVEGFLWKYAVGAARVWIGVVEKLVLNIGWVLLILVRFF